MLSLISRHTKNGFLPAITEPNNIAFAQINDIKIINTEKCRVDCKSLLLTGPGYIPGALKPVRRERLNGISS